MSREEFENLKPGMWITDGKHYFRITSQQDNEVTFFNMEEMDWDADNEEWIPLRTVNMNKYLLTRWEVFHPNEKTSDA